MDRGEWGSEGWGTATTTAGSAGQTSWLGEAAASKQAKNRTLSARVIRVDQHFPPRAGLCQGLLVLEVLRDCGERVPFLNVDYNNFEQLTHLRYETCGNISRQRVKGVLSLDTCWSIFASKTNSRSQPWIFGDQTPLLINIHSGTRWEGRFSRCHPEPTHVVGIA